MAINWHCVTLPLVRPVHTFPSQTDQAAVQLVKGFPYSNLSSCYGAFSFLLFSLIQGKQDTKESKRLVILFYIPSPCRSGPQSDGQTRAPRSHCSLSCGPRMVGQNNQRQRERYQYVKKLKRKGAKKHSDPTTGTPPSLN